MDASTTFGKILNIIIGLYTLIQGFLNVSRGNDFEFGVMLILLSFVFFLPVLKWFKNLSGIRLHYGFKVLLALLIIWVTLAVGAVNEGFYPEITG